jgi:hypothetical protein
MRASAARLLSLLSTAALVAAAPQGVQAEIVGTAGAVNPASTSAPPGGSTRVIQLGANVVHRERIQTSAQGSVQLVFVDKTSISIGPNSDLVIDEFVYDPGTGTGRMATTLAKGVLRFVGGNTSHTGGASIRTPAATLGIRGGVATAAHNAQDGTRAINHFGRTSVATGNSVEVISRPDFGVTVSPSGVPTPPTRVQAAELSALNNQLTSKPNQSGGAPRKPTPQIVQAAGLGTTQAALNAVTTPSLQGQTTSARTSAVTLVQQQAQVNQVIQQAVQVEASEETADRPPPPVSPPPISPPPPPISPPPPPISPPPPPISPPPSGPRFFALQMSVDPKLGSEVPYLPSDFVASGSFYNSPLLGVTVGETNSDGKPNTTSRVMQAGLNISGTGGSQTSTIYVATGNTYVSPINGQNILSGGFVATTRLAADLSAGKANGSLAGVGSDVVLDSDYTPTSATVTQDNLDQNDVRLSEPANAIRTALSARTDYAFRQLATQTSVPSGLGSSRPASFAIGFAGGLMQSFSLDRGTAYGDSYSVVGGAFLNFSDRTRRFGAYLGLAAEHSDDSNAGQLNDIALPFGYQGRGTSGGRGAFMDSDHFAARDSRSSSTGERLAEVNGSQVLAGSHALLVSAKTVRAENQAAFAGVNFCRCEYTRWGFWSSDTIRNAVTNTESSERLRDIGHLGTWVAGRPTDPALIPTKGSATFTGHVVASIKSSGREYVAAGNFSNEVNFATGVGAVRVSGLDGRTYAGSVDHLRGSGYFVGSLDSSSAGNPVMDVIGQFYDGPAGRAHEMGGGVRINGGPSYIGAGTFAAAR